MWWRPTAHGTDMMLPGSLPKNQPLLICPRNETKDLWREALCLDFDVKYSYAFQLLRSSRLRNPFIKARKPQAPYGSILNSELQRRIKAAQNYFRRVYHTVRAIKQLLLK